MPLAVAMHALKKRDVVPFQNKSGLLVVAYCSACESGVVVLVPYMF
jgi:hypothetical protein